MIRSSISLPLLLIAIAAASPADAAGTDDACDLLASVGAACTTTHHVQLSACTEHACARVATACAAGDDVACELAATGCILLATGTCVDPPAYLPCPPTCHCSGYSRPINCQTLKDPLS